MAPIDSQSKSAIDIRPAARARILKILNQYPAGAWAILIISSLLISGVLEALHLPAALLQGPMAAAILAAATGVILRVDRMLFVGAQAIIGCMIARAITPSILVTMWSHGLLFALTIFTVIASSAFLGWLLTRWRVFPGTTAVWGTSPGAASAMTLMAGAYGADMQLVAFMQYMRVVLVVLTATIVARIWAASSGGPVAGIVWFPVLHGIAFGETLALAALGAIAGTRLRIPAGALLVPLTVGSVLHGLGVMQIELPPWLLAASYAIVGWNIGLGFTPAILANAARAIPQVVASISVQILLCAGLAFLLTRLAGIEPLTAYLATSPGGADSVAIIAASSKVDFQFVMSLQAIRFLVIVATGPTLARFIAQRVSSPKRAPE
jgi:membrane AbrB-like protein